MKISSYRIFVITKLLLILLVCGLQSATVYGQNQCKTIYDLASLESIYQKQTEPPPLFASENYYAQFSQDPKLAAELMKKWYGVKFQKEWKAKVKFSKLDATPLLLDPGIADRAEEFFNFASDYLQTHQDVSLMLLREAFSNYLGKAKVYRAMVLDTATAKEILNNGIDSPGIHFNKTHLQDWMENKGQGPVQDMAARVQKDDGQSGLAISVSYFKEVALATASYRLRDSGADKSLYLFELVTDRINLVHEHQRLSTMPGFRSLVKTLDQGPLIIESPDGKWFNTSWETGGAEAFVFGGIRPSDVQQVSKIKDRRPWNIMTIGSARGTECLDPIHPDPLRRFQSTADQRGYFRGR